MKNRFLIFVLGVLAAAPLAISATSGKQPNILWLTSEDNSAHWLGCYSNPHAETPNLDRLAREGFQYRHTYANAPVCAPMRSTWITGVMAISMGTHPMRSFYRIPHDKIRLYPDYLNDNGYYTGNWKKMDYNFGGRNGSEAWDNPNEVDWKALKEQQPFFQVINHGQSHESGAFGDIENTEHDPADTTLAKYHPDVPDMRKNYAKYHDAIRRMDSAIGSALKKLEASGLADNTIVVYCSDHGGVLPRSKRFLFQNSLHCPLIIRIPEEFKHLWPAAKPGTQIDRLVSFVDMPKTWLSITGSAVPKTMQGTIFLGPKTETEPQFHFAFRGRMDERIDNARAVCDKRFLYIRNPKLYDVAALLDAADLALEENPHNLPQLRKLLDNPHVGLRYWGIVGCFLLDDREAAQKAINDESHEVRAMAAWLLIRTGQKTKGLACLRNLIEQKSYAILTLLNMAEWMGDPGGNLVPVIRKLEFKESWPKQYKSEIRMRDILLERFGGRRREK